VRKHAVGVSLAVVGVLLATAAVAVAAITPLSMTSRVTPSHINHAPFTWTDKGKVVLPPIVCAPGVTNPAYCSAPPPGSCSGTVAITVSIKPNVYVAPKGKVVKRYTTPLASNCSYSGATTLSAKLFKTKKFVKHGHKGGYVGVVFAASFTGNTTVSGISAKPQTVLARINGAKKKKK
jgi:hypothetical protein